MFLLVHKKVFHNHRLSHSHISEVVTIYLEGDLIAQSIRLFLLLYTCIVVYTFHNCVLAHYSILSCE